MMEPHGATSYDHMELRIFLPQLRHNTYFSQSAHSSETFSSKLIKKLIYPQALEKTMCWSCLGLVLAAWQLLLQRAVEKCSDSVGSAAPQQEQPPPD